MRPAITAATPPAICCNEELTDMYAPRSAGSGSAETPENDSPAEDQQNARLKQSRLRAFALEAAGRVVRREAKSLRKMHSKSAADPTGFDAEVHAFYRDLAPLVADTMLIPIAAATLYCNGHAEFITCAKSGLTALAIDGLEEEETAVLANLALSHTDPALLHKSA